MNEDFENIENTQEEVLDSPLVVHKIGDASYREAPSDGGMQTTHTDDDSDAPTLERHRFKKKKKIKKWPFVLIIIVAAVAIIIAVLVNNGTISFNNTEEETTQAKKSYTTQVENPFEGIITIKGTYVFFEGTEVDGISGLEREIKYLDEGTSFIIQDENADSNFLNYEALSMLTDYGMNYEITHVVSSGLISQYETAAEETTQEQTEDETQAEDNSEEQSVE